jgi:hypothetical protein
MRLGPEKAGVTGSAEEAEEAAGSMLSHVQKSRPVGKD